MPKITNIIALVGTPGPATGRDNHVELQAESDEFPDPPDSHKKLEEDLFDTQTAAYAKGTLRNLLCQWRSFVRFCNKYKISQWPVPEHTLCLYAQYLALHVPFGKIYQKLPERN